MGAGLALRTRDELLGLLRPCLPGQSRGCTPPPVRADQPPPAEPGMIPLTIPEIKRLLAALTTRPLPRWLVIHWDAWTRPTRPAHGGPANAPGSPVTLNLPWSASEMRLPYYSSGKLMAGSCPVPRRK